MPQDVMEEYSRDPDKEELAYLEEDEIRSRYSKEELLKLRDKFRRYKNLLVRGGYFILADEASKILRKIESALVPRVSARLEKEVVEVEVGSRAEATLYLTNAEKERVIVEVLVEAGEGATPGWTSKKVEVPPGKTILVKIPLKVEGSCALNLTVYPSGFKDSAEKLSMEVVAVHPKPDIRLDVKYGREVTTERLKVAVEVANRGRGAAKNVKVKLGRLEVELADTLKPGESVAVDLDLNVPRQPGPAKLGVPVVTYEDLDGREWVVEGKPIEVEVKPRAPPQPPQPPKTAESLDEALLAIIGGAVQNLILGYSAGKISAHIFRPKRKVVKPVVVSGLNYIEGKDKALAILEHPMAVTREDRGDYILFRRATVDEMLAAVSASAAKTLQIYFAEKLRSALARWEPPVPDSGQVKMRVERVDVRAKIKSMCKELGLEVDEGKLSKLPENPAMTWEWRRGMLRRKEYEVRAYLLSRLEELYFYNYDNKPMSLGDLEPLIPEEEPDHHLVIIAASPTGWDARAREFAQSHDRPRVHLILVDLKTLETYYNPTKTVLANLAAKITEGERTLIVPPEAEGELEKLDALLAKGRISVKTYLETAKKLGAKVL